MFKKIMNSLKKGKKGNNSNKAKMQTVKLDF